DILRVATHFEFCGNTQYRLRTRNRRAPGCRRCFRRRRRMREGRGHDRTPRPPRVIVHWRATAALRDHE
ncbi:unnamed protein product, partial [Pylaiella littoralis]